jgi:hypothetical protein
MPIGPVIFLVEERGERGIGEWEEVTRGVGGLRDEGLRDEVVQDQGVQHANIASSTSGKIQRVYQNICYQRQ